MASQRDTLVKTHIIKINVELENDSGDEQKSKFSYVCVT